MVAKSYRSELPSKAGHRFKTLFSPSTKVWNWFLASLILWIVHSSSKTGRPTNGTPGIGTLLSSQELPKCNGYLWFILAYSLTPLGGVYAAWRGLHRFHFQSASFPFCCHFGEIANFAWFPVQIMILYPNLSQKWSRRFSADSKNKT